MADYKHLNLKKSFSVDGDVTYALHTPEKSNAISLMMSGQDEMLRIAEDGFYVRGVKVEQDDREAAVVYNAFKQWLAWANLQRK